jgi:hypothetical protein
VSHRPLHRGGIAVGGAAGAGGSAGQGVGGGVYVTEGGLVCVDELTYVGKNRASTSHDDVFGGLG